MILLCLCLYLYLCLFVFVFTPVHFILKEKSSLQFSHLLYIRVCIQPFAFYGIVQSDSSKIHQAVFLPFSMPRWALWIMPKVSALLQLTIMASSSLCMNPLCVAFSSSSSQYTRVCVYVCVSLYMYSWRCFSFFSFCPVSWNYSLKLSVRLSHFVLLTWACQILLQKQIVLG